VRIRQGKKTEQQLSMKGLVTVCVSVLAGSGLLLLLAAGLSNLSLNADLEKARREWNDLHAQETAVLRARDAARVNETTFITLQNGEEGDWPRMYSVLRAVQENVPSLMRLYHFSADVAQDREKDALTRTLRISGTAVGELTAVDAKRQLTADARLRSFCGEIRLISSRRYFEESWAFALEGSRLAEGARQ
jgi:hypothetical protein